MKLQELIDYIKPIDEQYAIFILDYMNYFKDFEFEAYKDERKSPDLIKIRIILKKENLKFYVDFFMFSTVCDFFYEDIETNEYSETDMNLLFPELIPRIQTICEVYSVVF